MPTSTPIAGSKTAAMVRVLDSVPKGYVRFASGTVTATKAVALAEKFHALYGIGCTPAQRLTRKNKGKANAVLVMFWPEGGREVEWLLLATEGIGMEAEELHSVMDKPRLSWLGYELVRYATRGRIAWTWRRGAEEMADLHALLASQSSQRRYTDVAETLARIARQPGFHGVRTQSWRLFQEALRRGFPSQLPMLFYVQKVSHGARLVLT